MTLENDYSKSVTELNTEDGQAEFRKKLESAKSEPQNAFNVSFRFNIVAITLWFAIVGMFLWGLEINKRWFCIIFCVYALLTIYSLIHIWIIKWRVKSYRADLDKLLSIGGKPKSSTGKRKRKALSKTDSLEI